MLAAKTAVGVIRYSPHDVVAVIDSTLAGKTVDQVLGFGGPIPIVSSVDEILSLSPDVLLIGIAPTGGRLPEQWRSIVNDAIDAKLEIWSGLHSFLSDDQEFRELAEQKGVRLWDVRRPRPDLEVGMGHALNAKSYIVLTVGSDCNVGKMTTALELQKLANSKGFKAGFVATGQTGILIEGEGTPLDAIPGDFMTGEVERLVMQLDAEGCDVIFVEGQGSIVHPGFGPVTLGLMLGSMPDAFVLCHQPSRTNFRPDYDIALPALPMVIKQYEQLMEYYKAPRVQAIALNTFDLSAEEAAERTRKIAAAMDLPVADPIRDGVGALWNALEPLVAERREKNMAPAAR
jgi:uncharacterized NAD-dependent epimerase/dehydratase family protein